MTMTTATKAQQFSAQEKAAMRERARELKAQAQEADGQAAASAKIAQMPADEQVLATSFHALAEEVAPELAVKTWYGMPAYSTPGKSGKLICFFQSGAKMGTRYCTVGFSDASRLDDGSLWPTSFALTAWDQNSRNALKDLLSRAVPRS